jgi:hypothetical protein
MEPCYRHFAVKALIFQSFSCPHGGSERGTDGASPSSGYQGSAALRPLAGATASPPLTALRRPGGGSPGAQAGVGLSQPIPHGGRRDARDGRHRSAAAASVKHWVSVTRSVGAMCLCTIAPVVQEDGFS